MAINMKLRRGLACTIATLLLFCISFFHADEAQAGIVCQSNTKLSQAWVGSWTVAASDIFEWPAGTGYFLYGSYDGREASATYATDYRLVSSYWYSGSTRYIGQSVYSPGTRGVKSGYLIVVWC